MPIDRRENTRYIVQQPAIVRLQIEEMQKTLPVELIDLSTISARIVTREELPYDSEVILEVPSEITTHCPLALHADIALTRNGDIPFHHHILRFKNLDELQLSTLKKYLSAFMISDRRLYKQSATSTKSENSHERRLLKPVFTKCLRFNRVDKLFEKNLYFFHRELQSASAHRIIVNGREMINFGSNNYLGLNIHPAVKEAMIKATEKYGLGSGGVRMLSGTIDLHKQLERKLAAFKGAEDCIVYSTGYSTNVGVVSAIIAKNDTIFIDAKAHASIIDGGFLSGGNIIYFRHNDMKDLERKLEKADASTAKLIVTDGVFSMDGDIAPLDQIKKIADKFDAAVMVDDAHASGVIGANGRGTAEYFGMEGSIDLTIGTLSKGLAGVGGFCCANQRIIHYLKHVSRSFVFSTSLPPAVSAGLIKVIEVIETEPIWRKQLWENIDFLKAHLIEKGFDVGQTHSAVIPIIFPQESQTYQMTRELQDAGIFVSPVTYPAVRKRESRIRISVMATHTKDDLDTLLANVTRIGKKIGAI